MKMKKGGSVANKQSMNLAVFEKKQVNPVRILVTVLVLVLVFVVVGKFGIVDRYEKVDQARSAMQEQQDLYNALLIANAEYNDVLLEFNKYSFGAMTDEERAVADRGEVLDLIEGYLVSAAQIENVSLTANELNVEMSGINLEKASSLMNNLMTDELVKNVTVSNANTKEDESNSGENAVNNSGVAQDAKITLTITLVDNAMGMVSGEQTPDGEEVDDNE
ncbi:MAG: hypothetical protein SOW50_05545 [Lachnospiraceae bacterium]|nr:hypothetical protein [Lachnospiraceae bacterium]